MKHSLFYFEIKQHNVHTSFLHIGLDATKSHDYSFKLTIKFVCSYIYIIPICEENSTLKRYEEIEEALHYVQVSPLWLACSSCTWFLVTL